MKTAEEKKNSLDLRPTFEFVERHRFQYELVLNLLYFTTPHLVKNVPLVSCEKVDSLEGAGPQITPKEVPRILSRLPCVFLNLSLLEKVDYGLANMVPVPVFKEDGSWENVGMVPASEFPRMDDNPTRILIGKSDGKVIYPTALPASVHAGTRERWLYQLHVFLHKFFYTIELLRRDPEIRKRILFFRGDTNLFTFQDWWERWENLFLGTTKLRFPSRYAGNYGEFLTAEVRDADRQAFDRALAEQVCESFVGCILGIVPNDEDIPSFREHSPEAWGLFHELAGARIR